MGLQASDLQAALSSNQPMMPPGQMRGLHAQLLINRAELVAAPGHSVGMGASRALWRTLGTRSLCFLRALRVALQGWTTVEGEGVKGW